MGDKKMAETTIKLSDIKKYRELIKFACLAAYLHDLGKLSYPFLTKYLYEMGEEKHEANDWVHGDILEYDVGEKDWSDYSNKSRILHRSLYEWLKEPFCQYLPFQVSAENDYIKNLLATSISKIIKDHHCRDSDSQIIKLFRTADQHESGDEQPVKPGAQKVSLQYSTVFGWEHNLNDFARIITGEKKTIFSTDGYRCIRARVYDRLCGIHEQKVPDRHLFDALDSLFQFAIGKTMRQVNDTLLNQHVWGVASRFQASLHNAIQQEKCHQSKDADLDTYKFLSIGWDSWHYITPHARLVDIVARRELIDQVQDALRDEFEDKIALGNRVYKDDDGICFLVPDLPLDFEEIKSVVEGVLDHPRFDGDLPVKIKLQEDSTSTVCDMVFVNNQVRETMPYLRTFPWMAAWEKSPGARKCHVCQKRPVNAGEEICDFCLDLRRKAYQTMREDRKAYGTPWQGEISDKNNRLALMVLRFDLERWLNGDMLTTVFSSVPDEGETWVDFFSTVESKVNANDWEKSKFIEKAWYLKSAFKNQLCGSDFDDVKNNLIISKKPTMGRLLHLWQTTELFFKSIGGDITTTVGTRNRLEFDLKEPQSSPGRFMTVYHSELGSFDIYLAEEQKAISTEYIASSRVEAFLAEPVKSRTLQIRKTENENRGVHSGGMPDDQRNLVVENVERIVYEPFRIISQSPLLLLALVPADKSLIIAKKVYEKYCEWFGKVQGRLPLHCGLVFHSKHYPMFAAVDAARRLSESLVDISRLGCSAQIDSVIGKPVEGATTGEYPSPIELQLSSIEYGSWSWKVPYALGNGLRDDYHPYQFVSQKKESRLSIETPFGWMAHVTELAPEDVIKIWPCLFSYLFLETVSSRFEGNVKEPDSENAFDTASVQPYLFDRLSDFESVWGEISKFTPTRIRAVAEVLMQKRKTWYEHGTIKSKKAYQWLVEKVVKKDLEGNEILAKAVESGLFFETLNLYQYILKADDAIVIA